MQQCHVRWLGLIDYQQAWDLQNQLASKIATGESPPTLLLLEHPHTITFGRKGNPANLLWSESKLAQRGVQVFWVDRGGDVTYHGPGQLVGYPLIKLDSSGLAQAEPSSAGRIPQVDYITYLRNLEEVLIRALRTFGLQSERVEKLTGVWVKRAKIAAIGVKVDAHGVTHHGFALNVSPDMGFWDSIIGCGLTGHSVTSMACLMPDPPPLERVRQAVIAAFENVFATECLEVS